MKIYLTDQKYNLKKHLEYLKTMKVMHYDKSRLAEKTNTIKIETTKKIEQLNLNFLFDYHIFPKNIMSFKTQWADENRKMNLGDTIAQQVYIPPVKTFSQKIVFGVRINKIIDTPQSKGFSYETLEGHVEKGISIFTVEQLDSSLVFKIQTYSTPATFLTKLVGPIFSVPYQAFCTRAALKHVKQQLENL